MNSIKFFQGTFIKLFMTDKGCTTENWPLWPTKKVSTVTSGGEGTTGSNQEYYQTVSYGYTNKTFARRTEEALGSLQGSQIDIECEIWFWETNLWFPEERNNAEVGIQSANQVRPRSESSTLPIPDFLKDVTLEELLVAADNVRQRPSSWL